MTDTDRPTVLVVDDDERVAETYALRLGTEYETEIALGGSEALSTVDDSFDVVLLDRRMPDRSGDEVLEEIRRRSIDCRVVMVTAVDPEVDIAEMAFDDYVVKPVSREELRDVVERAVTISEYNDQVQQLSSHKLRRNVLEIEMDEAELENSSEYDTLCRKIALLEDEIDDIEEDLDIDQVDLYL